MKLVLFLSLLFTTNMFAQDWFELREPVIPMVNVYTDGRTTHRIQYYSMICKGVLYFNWVIKSQKKCKFLIEESIDAENFKVVQQVETFDTPLVELWYGIKRIPPCNLDCVWYRVIQVFEEDHIRYVYPSENITGKYQISFFERDEANF